MTSVVSATELADWLGVGRQSISQFAADGKVVRIKRGTYDLKASVQTYTAHLREVSAGRGGEAQVLDLTAERARLAKEQADHQEMKNAQLRGDLIHVDEVVRNWSDIFRRTSSAMTAIPDRLSGRYAIPLDLREALDREIRDTLNELASDEEGAPPGTRQLPAADEIEAQRMG